MASLPRVIVSTWVYCEDSGMVGKYPQVAGDPTSADWQSVYWRCAAVSMLSARAAFADGELVLYTNVASLPVVDGVDMAHIFAQLRVVVRRVELTHVLEGEGRCWRNQFYVFDVLQDLASRADSGDVLIVADGDCVWTRPPEDFVRDVAAYGAVTYRIDYDESIPVNGLSLRDALQVRGKLRPDVHFEAPSYYGGELIAVTGEIAREICELSSPLLDANLELQRLGKPFLPEEAHVLSALYDQLGVGNDVGNRYTKRMWTSLRCHNVVSEDAALLLWHLPAEKGYAFELMFRQAMRFGLFDRASSSSADVLARVRKVLGSSWQFGPNRLRFDTTRALIAVKKRLAVR